MDLKSYLLIFGILVIPFLTIVQFVRKAKKRENPKTIFDYIKFVLKVLTTLILGLILFRYLFADLFDVFFK